jgi:lysophospholipase L1-like esterase
MSWTDSSVKKALALFVIVTLGISTIILIIELVSAAIIREKSEKFAGLTLQEYILSKPKAFDGVDDYEEIRRLWAGADRCPHNRIVNDHRTGFPKFELQNVSCNSAETVSDGLRLTTNQPTDPKRRVLMFGGSTMWGTGSADRNTIPSILQKMLNSSHPSQNFQVINFGFSTVVAHQQLSKLRTVQIKKGDVVIFYDGGNDIYQGVVYGDPEGTIIGYNEAHKFEVYLNQLKFFLSRHSSFYQLMGELRNNGLKSVDCKEYSQEEILRRTKLAFNVYLHSIKSARDYVENQGGVFLHFFQPTHSSRHQLTENEESLISNKFKCSFKMQSIAANIYREKLALERNLSVDLSLELDAVNDGREYFFDWIHVSSAGNKLIASKIHQHLDNQLSRY